MLSRPVIVVSASALLCLFLFANFLNRDGSHTAIPGYNWGRGQSTQKVVKEKVPPSLASLQNQTLGFEKIFVLNLPERTDKKDFMSLAAAYSDLKFDYWPGIKGADVPTKALPEGHENREMGEAPIGSWRGHMNIIREIVDKRVSSALIMEDDMDWSIGLKDQLPDFARGVRTFYNQTDDSKTHSPYGDGWDVLWLGKCIEKWQEGRSEERQVFVIENDMTVPLLKNMAPGDGRDMLGQLGLPEHTRIVHRMEDPICTFAYGVSYEGARKMLYSLSVGGLAWNFDNSLSWWCTDESRAWNQECIGVTPTLFSQHRVKSSISRNSDNFEEQGKAEESHTKTIRVSVKMNIEALIKGTGNYTDAYPDDMEPYYDDEHPRPPRHEDSKTKEA